MQPSTIAKKNTIILLNHQEIILYINMKIMHTF